MSKDKTPEGLSDSALDQAQGGGLLDAQPGTFGFEPITLERGARWTDHNNSDPGFIGETEKNVWKAPAGTEAD